MFNYSSLLGDIIGRRVFVFPNPIIGEFLEALQYLLKYGTQTTPDATIYVKIHDSEFRVTGFTATEERLPDGTFSTRIDLHLE